MIWIKTEFPNGKECYATHCETVIPHGNIEGLTAEQIGQMIIALSRRGAMTTNWLRLCNGGSGYVSLEEFDNVSGPVKKDSSTIDRPLRSGYVYVMIDRRTRYYKIGWSTTPEYREQTLHAEQPKIELLYYWPGTMAHERQLHRQFTDRRIRGEWFNLSSGDIRAIEAFFEELQIEPRFHKRIKRGRPKKQITEQGESARIYREIQKLQEQK